MWRGLGVVSQPYLFVWWSVTLKIWDVLLPSSHQWQKLCFKTSKENLRSHKVRLRRNKQQLFASVTTLLACFHCAVHWTWQLACKPVSVWFGCSADKLDCVVLSVGALLSALFWCDATVSLLDDFQCCMILNLNFFVCIITFNYFTSIDLTNFVI